MLAWRPFLCHAHKSRRRNPVPSAIRQVTRIVILASPRAGHRQLERVPGRAGLLHDLIAGQSQHLDQLRDALAFILSGSGPGLAGQASSLQGRSGDNCTDEAPCPSCRAGVQWSRRLRALCKSGRSRRWGAAWLTRFCLYRIQSVPRRPAKSSYDMRPLHSFGINRIAHAGRQ
jgi:hypothetical protein